MSYLSSPQEVSEVWLFCFVSSDRDSVYSRELTVSTRPVSSLQRSSCLCLLSPGMKMCATMLSMGMFCNKPHLKFWWELLSATALVAGQGLDCFKIFLVLHGLLVKNVQYKYKQSTSILSFQDSTFFESKLMGKGLYFYGIRYLCLTHSLYTPILVLNLLGFI